MHQYLQHPADWYLGQSQFLTSPIAASHLKFNLALDDPEYDTEKFAQRVEDNDTRLMSMLAAQAAHRENGSPGDDEEAIALNESLSETEKRVILQKSLHMAASNGDVERVKRLVNSQAKDYVDINGADEEGSAPLIYASCFVGYVSF